jgi:hypothetical protein
MISSAVKGGIKEVARNVFYTLILIALSYQFPCTATTITASSVTLAWDQSPDPSVAGYKVYYGTASRTYGNVIGTGNQTSVTISNLAPSTTYYFAATTVTSQQLESDYSAETTYTVPSPNLPPTLDPIANLVLNEGAGMQTVNLLGISSGSANEVQTLAVSAFSSNPGLIPNPAIDYVSPNATGILTFTPVAGSSGSATLTVMVDDGGTVSNTVIRSFLVTVIPVNSPPTLDPLKDLTISENAGVQTVNLSAITTGSASEIQTLSVTATSSNPGLIPAPVVNYTSPNSTGTLRLTPVTNMFGSATIIVTVNDGQPTNSTVTQTFLVTVNQTTLAQSTLTNAVIAPNTPFQFLLSPPDNSGHKFSYNLGTDAPLGTSILTKKGTSFVVWIPSFSQAATTNLFTIQATDRTTSVSTNQSIKVIVLDYLSVRVGSTSVQAGQNAALPLFLSSSDGVTNMTFTVDWPSSRFANPSLSSVYPGIATSSVQNQGTNLLINLQSVSGQSLQGSNLIAQLTFQTISNQSSAFVSLPIRIVNANKPNAVSYAYYAPVPGQVVVVNDMALLQASGSTGPSRTVIVYGRVGTMYQLQSSTNVSIVSAWTKVVNYKQTTVAKTFDVSRTAPLVFYRVVQQ